MAVPLYLDVHVPLAIAHQLRHREVDVVHALEEGTNRLADDELLDLAGQQSRVVVTQDIRFWVMAEEWQRRGRPFFGLIYGRQQSSTIGGLVRDLELVAKATEPAEWMNQVLHLPL